MSLNYIHSSLTGKNIKKRFIILINITIALTIIFSVTYLCFRSTRVQTVVAQWFTSQLSTTFKARISVGGVQVSLFKSIILEDVLIEDQNQDTLLYVGNLKLQIDSLNLLAKKVHFGDLNFEDSKINLSKDKKGFNYQFLTESTESEIDSLNPWHLTFHNLYLRNSNLKYR